MRRVYDDRKALGFTAAFETISDMQISLCIDSILITEGKEVYGTWIYKTVF